MQFVLHPSTQHPRVLGEKHGSNRRGKKQTKPFDLCLWFQALLFSQLAAFVAGASKLSYFVDNVSDLWPVLLSTAATLKYTYNPKAYTNKTAGGWNDTQHAFLVEWCTTQYGAVAAEEAATLYARYFALPHIMKGWSDEWLGRSLGKKNN